MSRPTPAELGARAAATAPPLTDDQVEAAARVLAGVENVPTGEGSLPSPVVGRDHHAAT